MVSTASLAGRRVLITGAARGIGAALAQRLHQRGARVALAGLEPDLLAEVAKSCGDAPWCECNVADREQVNRAVTTLVDALGGLDVVVANAGTAAQMTMVDGDHRIMERTLAVNALGVYYTLAAAGPHISHRGGYALVTSSAAAGLHLPLMSAYCASKAAVEAMADCMRAEVAPSGAMVGVAYFAEIDTDMTSRGMQTKAGEYLSVKSPFTKVSPLSVAIDAVEAGIARRARRVYAPRWVGFVLPVRMGAQRMIELGVRRRVAKALDLARDENAPLTTPQPD
ncbi:MAG TPA: SDR family NAD(P)-dependent oxidoreductase [Mycobacteriales bacterium]|nr:SDR family NAD(P)-dependent oxidoreductase [Mycobacteriales bacterium]